MAYSRQCIVVLEFALNDHSLLYNVKDFGECVFAKILNCIALVQVHE